MTIISIITFSLIALAILGLSIFFVFLINKNMKQGENIRIILAKRVESLRMSKMLNALGLDFNSYMFRAPLSRINDSMDKCESCTATEQCDEALTKKDISVDNIDFCANQECLGKLHALSKNPE